MESFVRGSLRLFNEAFGSMYLGLSYLNSQVFSTVLTAARQKYEFQIMI